MHDVTFAGLWLAFEKYDEVSAGSAKKFAHTLSMAAVVCVVVLVFCLTLVRPV